ncbi:MAG: ACT domain-containing protein, partial [Wolinella sp.]
EGEVAGYLDSLATFGLVGALNASLGDKVNYVNAPYVAKERGIELKKESKSAQSGYQNMLTIKLVTEKGELSLSGTVFGENLQRIVEIEGFGLDIEPKGRMILFQNTDVPGVIGMIGTILANHHINISDFRLGRNGRQALAVILVDSGVSKEVLDELGAIEACLGIRHVLL